MLHYIKTLPISTRLWLLVGIFSLVVLTDNLSAMVLHGKRLRAEKEQQLEQLVETAHSILRHYEGESRAGRLSDAQARNQAIGAIRPLRYSEREYFWIHDLGQPVPRMVMHPTVPGLDGTVLDAPGFLRATSSRRGSQGPFNPLAGDNLFIAMNDVVRSANGEGFVTYEWNKPIASGGVTEERFPKLSYVKRFEPWGWVIGSGIYMDEFEATYWHEVRINIIKTVVWLVLFGLMAWIILRTIIRPLRALQQSIDDLRSNPDSIVRLAADQPQELGNLGFSFLSLMNDLHDSLDALRLAGCAFDEMSEGVVVVDASGRIVSTNPALTRLMGYQPEEMIGSTTARFRADVQQAVSDDALWAQVRQDGQWSGTVWNQAKDGSLLPQWLAIRASHNQQGQVQCYFGVLAVLAEPRQPDA